MPSGRIRGSGDIRYVQFEIEHYRGIQVPLHVDLERHELLPIVGINESGKTTILHAVLAFDYMNDSLDESVQHLINSSNLNVYEPQTPHIRATLSIPHYRLHLALTKDLGLTERKARAYLLRIGATDPAQITITRDLHSLEYDIPAAPMHPDFTHEKLARALIRRAPYIMYFDDFRGAFDDEIVIVQGQKSQSREWIDIFERLFKKTNKDFSLYTLNERTEPQRLLAIAAVERALNDTLTAQWHNFQLDDKQALRIELEYLPPSEADADLGRLKIRAREADAEGNERFFYVRNRCKGFYWFFNFVMKLEFNPKVVSDDGMGTVYLLDEPGSYLHAAAQERLCEKLRTLSRSDSVIYCTHSHHLLNPQFVPFSSIHISDRDDQGYISLHDVANHPGDLTAKRSAYQPIHEALQLGPMAMSNLEGHLVLVEGINDYFAYEMLKPTADIHFFPSTGADSVQYLVSWLIAWGGDFRVLWDNDDQGRLNLKRATAHFGSEFSDVHFRLVPLIGVQPKRKSRLEDLFALNDLTSIRDRLGLSQSTKFAKVIPRLFYSSERKAILDSLSKETKDNFGVVVSSLGFD